MTIVSPQQRAALRTESPLGPPPRRNLAMLTDRIFPALRALIRTGYFSLEVQGAEHVPTSGAAIYVGNHAGWFTLDTLMGALAVADHVGIDRLPWGAVQDQLLRTPTVGPFFAGLGGFPASWMREPARMPAEMEVFSVYPEGVEGNCKSFLDAYQMRPWRTGFVHMAAARRALVVPVAIIGGEECLPALSSITAVKPLLGTILPLPLSVLPLPSRWKIVFHRPVPITEHDLGGPDASLALRKQRARQIADRIRDAVKQTVERETADHALVRLSKLIRGTRWSHRREEALQHAPSVRT